MRQDHLVICQTVHVRTDFGDIDIFQGDRERERRKNKLLYFPVLNESQLNNVVLLALMSVVDIFIFLFSCFECESMEQHCSSCDVVDFCCT